MTKHKMTESTDIDAKTDEIAEPPATIEIKGDDGKIISRLIFDDGEGDPSLSR